MNKMVKVLVTDDSLFMRKIISDFLNAHPQISVVATAKNGQEALEKINEFSPDVVTLDVEMPVLDGLSTLENIMTHNPLPVIMLSSTTESGAVNTIKAMELGAIDFIPKPSGSISLDLYKVKEELIEKVLLASTVIPPKKNSQKTERTKSENSKKYLKVFNGKVDNTIIGIGTSTGGPRALQEILCSLPKQTVAPIFIVQHMPPHFTKSLANRLNSVSEITVVEAVHGQKVEKGTAYIAPGGLHMEVAEQFGDLTIQLSETEPFKGHRPSVNKLFYSLSLLRNYKKIAVVMTGMGTDGTDGILQLKKNDESTVIIAESEESSVIFGMPKAAIQTGKVDEIVHLQHVTNTILKYI
ncbi:MULTISPECIES: protein-glutamate methylesterase/protein-glutamine glutaminase [Sutcliffiella]|uniref:Protein-glutamate methylesterase/protein-glutamine glutaminase n=1 Tax=Sutcliffiella cohnii TaxID=33932 RepID=A0A223KRC5_9BACI|nr:MULTISPECIES: chemotaxis response regulator protein-glutamate methylesterase [Sutcliffiella]AST92040.1 chemotaxis response regulator protein-glutamate methylesterase [Sutcliffiella cohnii]WBL13274.1 chemotaxis response regulator protein-glutamate methylesterase [Sutcliffiella sp. NC1]